MALMSEMYKTITVKEACEILGMGKTKVYEMLSEGSLRGFRIGNAWRTTDRVCYEFIEEQMRIQRLTCENQRTRRR